MHTFSQFFFLGLALLCVWRLYCGLTTGEYSSNRLNASRATQPVKFWCVTGAICAILAFCLYGLAVGL